MGLTNRAIKYDDGDIKIDGIYAMSVDQWREFIDIIDKELVNK